MSPGDKFCRCLADDATLTSGSGACRRGAAPCASAFEDHPSTTFEDWAENADAVVLARVTGERRREPADDHTEPGRYPVSRDVTVQVSAVYWQRGPRRVPKVFEMAAWGWMAAKDGAERPIVAPGASRLQEGHEYLVALDWRRGWTVLGSGATLPADGVVGVGEQEGRLVVRADERRAESADVAEAVAGLAPDEAGRLIGRVMEQAVPRPVR